MKKFNGVSDKPFQRCIKSIVDFSLAAIMLVLLSPLFCVIALLVKLDSKGPVFFTFTRVGKSGKKFSAYKFRSMVQNAAKIGAGIEIVKNDPRITKIGKFLRAWSLDELPQLLNVIKGEMSWVGPRPALPHQVEKYSEFEKNRFLVKPGITGWAQINGRNLISWPERIKLDVWYIENWSLFLDIKILFMTPKVVLSKEGLYGKEGAVKDYE
ncbi:MAG: exopolysaccharide biosynthesis polyprenyl glycosylphosphotransferase [Candidatus Omnitrophota bacterium]